MLGDQRACGCSNAVDDVHYWRCPGEYGLKHGGHDEDENDAAPERVVGHVGDPRADIPARLAPRLDGARNLIDPCIATLRLEFGQRAVRGDLSSYRLEPVEDAFANGSEGATLSVPADVYQCALQLIDRDP